MLKRRWEESLLEISPLPRAAIDYPLPPPPPPPPATTPRSSSSNTTTATSTTTTRRRGSLSIATTTNGVVDSHTPPPPPPAPPTTTTASLSGDGYHLPDHLVSSHETEAALSLALEASRNEASALRIAYTYANEKYQEVKLAYNTLLDQIQEEGSMLTKRDQERYRLALKDLADYEIYKQVMEAAMVKLNNELACYVKENDHLKLMRQQEERERSRQKVGQEKYGKDLVATKKKLAELEARLPHDEKKMKQLQRERDAAVTALAQSQTTLVTKVSQLEETLSLRQKEVEELTKRNRSLEERVRSLEHEKETLLGSHNAEVVGLRNAHSKALETLMTYQEENDILRSTIQDMSSGNSGNSGATNHHTANGSVKSTATSTTVANLLRRADSEGVGRRGGAGGGQQNVLRFYTDASPGFQIGPTTVLASSLLFIGLVVVMHIVGKFAS
eukprot:gene9347-10319_t